MLGIFLFILGSVFVIAVIGFFVIAFSDKPSSSNSSYSQDIRTPKEREMDRLRSENERLRREKKALEEKEERERFFVEASIAGVFDDDL